MKTLVEQLRRNLERDLGDAPAVNVQDAVDLQDLGWMPEGVEPSGQPVNRQAAREGRP